MKSNLKRKSYQKVNKNVKSSCQNFQYVSCVILQMLM